MQDKNRDASEKSIAELLSILSPEEREVIVMRFFESDGPRTIEETASALGIKTELCSILEEAAFRKLPSLRA